MSSMKSLISRKPPKDQREKLVLFGLIDLYIETGKAVGSHTLQENGFQNLSSSTIRNYFARLEEAGYLKQQHSSGGRIPTTLAFQLYAQAHLNNLDRDVNEEPVLEQLLDKETRELSRYLQSAMEVISETTKCATFLSAPRFNQDFILDIKLVSIDQHRCLCILITDFGVVQTEILFVEKKLTNFIIKRLEAFMQWHLNRVNKPQLTPEEEALAHRLYSEVMLRYLVKNTTSSSEDIYRTGFSKLLSYSDFNDATALASGLALFENRDVLYHLLQETVKAGKLSCWMGGNLEACSAIAVPYRIHQTIVGAIAILGPNRIPYRKLFNILEKISDIMSHSLTKSIYKFKVSFKQTEKPMIQHLLLENKI